MVIIQNPNRSESSFRMIGLFPGHVNRNFEECTFENEEVLLLGVEALVRK